MSDDCVPDNQRMTILEAREKMKDQPMSVHEALSYADANKPYFVKDGAAIGFALDALANAYRELLSPKKETEKEISFSACAYDGQLLCMHFGCVETATNKYTSDDVDQFYCYEHATGWRL